MLCEETTKRFKINSKIMKNDVLYYLVVVAVCSVNAVRGGKGFCRAVKMTVGLIPHARDSSEDFVAFVSRCTVTALPGTAHTQVKFT